MRRLQYREDMKARVVNMPAMYKVKKSRKLLGKEIGNMDLQARCKHIEYKINVIDCVTMSMNMLWEQGVEGSNPFTPTIK